MLLAMLSWPIAFVVYRCPHGPQCLSNSQAWPFSLSRLHLTVTLVRRVFVPSLPATGFSSACYIPPLHSRRSSISPNFLFSSTLTPPRLQVLSRHRPLLLIQGSNQLSLEQPWNNATRESQCIRNPSAHMYDQNMFCLLLTRWSTGFARGFFF
ncbi:hypothetical protein EDB84DRAFT_1479244 [Lactarius hengduanensis]|nr:hypothetical protein EDB84DRAFT_1479244 [Lactarius hengduanensis]